MDLVSDKIIDYMKKTHIGLYTNQYVEHILPYLTQDDSGRFIKPSFVDDLSRWGNSYSWSNIISDEIIKVYPVLKPGKQPILNFYPSPNTSDENKLHWHFIINIDQIKTNTPYNQEYPIDLMLEHYFLTNSTISNARHNHLYDYVKYTCDQFWNNLILIINQKENLSI